MKRSIMLIACFVAVCNICNAQTGQRSAQTPAPEAPPKVTALKPLQAAKPIAPGGEYKAPQQTLALPSHYVPKEMKDRTEIPVIKLPVNTMPAVAAAPKPIAPSTPAVQTPGQQ